MSQFDISLDNEIMLKCGDRFLNDEEIKKYTDIYTENYETILNLQQLAEQYWNIMFDNQLYEWLRLEVELPAF